MTEKLSHITYKGHANKLSKCHKLFFRLPIKFIASITKRNLVIRFPSYTQG